MNRLHYILASALILSVAVPLVTDGMPGTAVTDGLSFQASDSTVVKHKTLKEALADFENGDSITFSNFTEKAKYSYETDKNDMIRYYQQFRDSVMKDYIEALGRPWEKENTSPALPRPIDNSVGPDIVKDRKPDVMPVVPKPRVDDDSRRDKDKNIKPGIDKEIKIKDVFTLPRFNPDTRPEPFVPVVIPDDVEVPGAFTFRLFGTDFKVNMGDDCRFRLSSATNKGVAGAIKTMSGNKQYDVILQQCLDIRRNYLLCDWAYYQMLRALGDKFFGSGTNESVLFSGYMFCMSGYKLRFAFDSSDRLQHLISCDQDIVDVPYITIPGFDGNDTYYIISNNITGTRFQVCNYEMPGEKSMSLYISDEPLFDNDIVEFDMQLHSYDSVKFHYVTNKNLIDFYSTYPVPMTRGDSFSKWTYYAGAPMSNMAKGTVYVEIAKAINGRSRLEAVNIIMDFIESFKYGYDDKIWGYDRAFFPDETIYYPMSDCEDHAILLTRIVRDMLNLPTALVYYPGHLAAAVCFNDEDVKGDYIMHDNRKYTICDPTIYYSGAGHTMRGMNNKESTLIIIR